MANDVLTDNPQVAAQLRQLLAERENAEAYGLTERLAAVDKQLATLGYRPEKQAAKAVDTEPAKAEPKGRQAPARRTA